MSRKLKRHILFPAILLIYIAVMAVIAFPRYSESGNWLEYIAVLGVCIVFAVLLFFILKRKENIREKFKNR